MSKTKFDRQDYTMLAGKNKGGSKKIAMIQVIGTHNTSNPPQINSRIIQTMC